jgi:hypothetical protein
MELPYEMSYDLNASWLVDWTPISEQELKEILGEYLANRVRCGSVIRRGNVMYRQRIIVNLS